MHAVISEMRAYRDIYICIYTRARERLYIIYINDDDTSGKKERGKKKQPCAFYIIIYI